MKALPTWGSAWRAGATAARQRARAGPQGRHTDRRMRGQPGPRPYRTAEPGPGRSRACGLHKVIADGAGPGVPSRAAGRLRGAEKGRRRRRLRVRPTLRGPSVRRKQAAARPAPAATLGPANGPGRGLATPGLVRPPRPGRARRGRTALPSPSRPAAARRRPLTLLRRPALPRQEDCGEGREGGLPERSSPCRGWSRLGLVRLAGWAGLAVPAACPLPVSAPPRRQASGAAPGPTAHVTVLFTGRRCRVAQAPGRLERRVCSVLSACGEIMASLRALALLRSWSPLSGSELGWLLLRNPEATRRRVVALGREGRAGPGPAEGLQGHALPLFGLLLSGRLVRVHRA